MRNFLGGLRNFRGGVEKFSGGGGWEIFWGVGGCTIFGGFEKFSGGEMRNFWGRGLSREGLIFFGRGDIFSRGVGNFLGAVLRFFGCGWELFGRPG